MAFKKGQSGNPKGREKGSSNKFNKQFKDLLTETYQALEEKTGHGLQKWAEEHPTDFYRICAKLVPQQITGEGGGPIEIVQTYTLPDGSTIEFPG